MEKETKGKANTVQIQYYQSPCGTLILGSFENKLCMCDWVVSEERRAAIDKRIFEIYETEDEAVESFK